MFSIFVLYRLQTTERNKRFPDILHAKFEVMVPTIISSQKVSSMSIGVHLTLWVNLRRTSGTIFVCYKRRPNFTPMGWQQTEALNNVWNSSSHDPCSGLQRFRQEMPRERWEKQLTGSSAFGFAPWSSSSSTNRSLPSSDASMSGVRPVCEWKK